MKRILVLTVLAFALMTTPAMAKEGLYLGGLLMWNDISEDVSNLDSGSGWGLRGGFGIGRYFAVEGTLFNTEHDGPGGSRPDFTGLTVDAKVMFPLSGSNLEPYIRVGVGTYELEAAGNPEGEGTHFGFGIEYYFVNELSLNIGYTKRNIDLDEGVPGTLNIDVDSVDVGITYHFI